MTQHDLIPDREKFGYKAMVEKDEIRARLKAEGYAGAALHCAVEAAYIEAHRNDPTYAEKSKARRETVSPPPIFFTPDELRYIAYKLAGSNDPDGVSALVKTRGMLADLKTS